MKKQKRVFILLFVVLFASAVGFSLHKSKDGDILTRLSAGQPVSGVGSTQTAALAESEDARQIILSMGQTPDILFLSWTGDRKGPAYIRYGTDAEDLPLEESIKVEGQRILAGRAYRYSVRLKGLKAGEIYYYEIGDGTVFDSPRAFQVPGERGAVEFLFLGDVQFVKSVKEYGQWGRMVDLAERENPSLDFVVIGGDMVNIPLSKKQWDGFLDNSGNFATLPLMTAAGNHEGVRSNRTYQKIFALPKNGPKELKETFYYFDYGECRIIVMDSTFLAKGRRRALGNKTWKLYEKRIENWLKKTLQQSDKAWNIVVIHHPPYGLHDMQTVSPQIRKQWSPIMEEGQVDLVLCGHQHMYMRTERINNILYVMGNSGLMSSKYYTGYNAPLYSSAIYGGGPNYQVIKATMGRLRITSYDETGSVIDEASLRRVPDFQVLDFLRNE